MTDTVVAKPLPHWDMTPYYPSLTSDEFTAAVSTFKQDLDALESLVADKTADVPLDPTADLETMLTAFIGIFEQLVLVNSYIYGFLAVNSRDAVAQARISEMQIQAVRVSKAQTRLTAWIGKIDVDVLIGASSLAAEHAYLLRNARIEAQHLMPQPDEDLAAEMTLSGGSAFGKLHDDISS
jgi:oligoendopeptidase F